MVWEGIFEVYACRASVSREAYSCQCKYHCQIRVVTYDYYSWVILLSSVTPTQFISFGRAAQTQTRAEADLSNSHTESPLHLESWCNCNALRLYIPFIFPQFSLLKINLFWKVEVHMWQCPLWISPGSQTLLPVNGSIVVLPNAPSARLCFLLHYLGPRQPINAAK